MRVRNIISKYKTIFGSSFDKSQNQIHEFQSQPEEISPYPEKLKFSNPV